LSVFKLEHPKVANMIHEIIAYHPEIHINKNGEHHLLKLSIPDFESDEDILRTLAKKVGAITVGDIATAVQNNKIDATLEKTNKQTIWGKVWDWEERIC